MWMSDNYVHTWGGRTHGSHHHILLLTLTCVTTREISRNIVHLFAYATATATSLSLCSIFLPYAGPIYRYFREEKKNEHHKNSDTHFICKEPAYLSLFTVIDALDVVAFLSLSLLSHSHSFKIPSVIIKIEEMWNRSKNKIHIWKLFFNSSFSFATSHEIIFSFCFIFLSSVFFVCFVCLDHLRRVFVASAMCQEDTRETRQNNWIREYICLVCMSCMSHILTGTTSFGSSRICSAINCRCLESKLRHNCNCSTDCCCCCRCYCL